VSAGIGAYIVLWMFSWVIAGVIALPRQKIEAVRQRDRVRKSLDEKIEDARQIAEQRDHAQHQLSVVEHDRDALQDELDAARIELASLRPADFPNVLLESRHAIVVETRDLPSAPDRRETIIAVGIRATNRETERNAILSFTAFIQTTRPVPAIRKLSRVLGEWKANLPDPWKIEAQDWGEGELLFSWWHDMDFLLERDCSEERAIELLVPMLKLSAQDSLTGFSVEVPTPEDWLKL